MTTESARWAPAKQLHGAHRQQGSQPIRSTRYLLYLFLIRALCLTYAFSPSGNTSYDAAHSGLHWSKQRGRELIGLIQKVWLSLLEQEGGSALRERVLLRAGMPADASFRINQNYPDAQVQALMEATLSETGLSRAQLMQRYASFFLDYVELLFPRFFSMSGDARAFLLRQPVIHASFGAGLRSVAERDAVIDKFDLREAQDGSLNLHYDSPNRLCDLYAALARTLGERYGEQITVETLHCAACSGGATQSKPLVARESGGGTAATACTLRVYWPEMHSPSVLSQHCCHIPTTVGSH